MSERRKYAPGVPCWVDTIQPDPRAALGFYGALFEWDFAGPGSTPGDPPGQYFVARVKGRDVAGIGSRPSNGPPGATWNTYVRVDSADEAVSAARRAGGSVLESPFDVPPAGRAAVLADPAGAPFCVWEPRDREGAQLVNEPRAWSMSSLHTSDPEGAKAFYGAVFGWRPEVFGAGGIDMTLWRLPGYVGGEPEQPVPRDVVGVMVPAAGADRGAPPYWSVDFWVASVDAVADRAARLGGKIVVPAHDTPGFRRAAISDPHGATFWIDQLIAGPPQR